MVVAEQSSIESVGVDISDTLKARFMPFFQDQIVSSGSSIVLIGQKALLGVLSIIAQLSSLGEDILIDRHVVPSHHDPLHSTVIVQPIKLMASYLNKPNPLVAGCK